MEQQNVGSFLKTLRREKNLTQEQLAEQLHVSGRTVSRWETGSNMPDITLLVALAEFYEVSIPEIIDGERKSETMNEEAKETALKLSDYAEIVNRKLKTRLLWMTLAALVGMVVFAALDILGLHTPFYDFVAGVGLGLGYGMLAVLALYLSGILGQIKARRLMRREARSNI